MGRLQCTTSAHSSGWLAGFITLLSLSLIAAGCSKSDTNHGKDPQPEVTSPIEPPPDVHAAAQPEKTEPPPNKELLPDKKPREEPSLILPLEQDAFFMGTKARGQRFCIIADASNSMKGAPLNQLKKEILQTLEGLKPTSSFYLIFFNATDIPMPFPTWLKAEKENLDKVRPFVQDISLALYTKPTSAFERAFKLSPKPDVIFFMTDGFVQGFSPAKVTRLNATEPKVIVHTLMFTRKKVEMNPGKAAVKADSQLRAIAEENGGTFRHVTQK